MKRSPIARKTQLRSRSPIKQGGTPIKKVNRKRKAANLLRAHGPEERREWIKTLPCAQCGVQGFSEGAHIRNGGTSRKADAQFTIPLCRTRPRNFPLSMEMIEGCHQLQHRVGWSALPRFVTLERRKICAALVEEIWQMELRGRKSQERSRRVDRQLAALGIHLSHHGADHE